MEVLGFQSVSRVVLLNPNSYFVPHHDGSLLYCVLQNHTHHHIAAMYDTMNRIIILHTSTKHLHL